MKDFKIQVPITPISDMLFDSEVHPKPIEETGSDASLEKANEDLKEMCEEVKEESIFGFKDHPEK